MALATNPRNAASLLRKHWLAAGMALVISLVAVVAATTREPWLVDYLFIVGSICSVAGLACFFMGVIGADAAVISFVGGAVLGLLPMMLPDEPVAPIQVEHRPSVVRSAPPILIDHATGCEWIGSDWNRAKPRIGSDGATICNGASTGKAPTYRP